MYKILNVEFDNELAKFDYYRLDADVMKILPFEIPPATQSWDDKYNFVISPTTNWVAYLDIPRLKAELIKILQKNADEKRKYVRTLGIAIHQNVVTLGNLIRVVQENNKLDAIQREYLESTARAHVVDTAANFFDKLPSYFNITAIHAMHANMKTQQPIADNVALLNELLLVAGFLLLKAKPILEASQVTEASQPDYYLLYNALKNCIHIDLEIHDGLRSNSSQNEWIVPLEHYHQQNVLMVYLDLQELSKKMHDRPKGVTGKNSYIDIIFEMLKVFTDFQKMRDTAEAKLQKNASPLALPENVVLKHMKYFNRFLRDRIYHAESFLLETLHLPIVNKIYVETLTPATQEKARAGLIEYYTALRYAFIYLYHLINYAVDNVLGNYPYAKLLPEYSELIEFKHPQRETRIAYTYPAFNESSPEFCRFIDIQKVNAKLAELFYLEDEVEKKLIATEFAVQLGKDAKAMINAFSYQIALLKDGKEPNLRLEIEIAKAPKLVAPQPNALPAAHESQKSSRPLVNSIDSLTAIFNKPAIVDMHTKMKIGKEITSNALLIKELLFVTYFLLKQVKPLLHDEVINSASFSNLYKQAEATVKIGWYSVESDNKSPFIHWEVDTENFNQQVILTTYLNLDEVLNRINSVNNATVNIQEQRINFCFEVLDSCSYFINLVKAVDIKINNTPSAIPEPNFILKHLKYFNRFWREKIYHPENFLSDTVHTSIENEIFKDYSLGNQIPAAKGALEEYYRALQIIFIYLYKIIDREVDNILVESPVTKLLPAHDAWLVLNLAPITARTVYVDYELPAEAQHFLRYINLKNSMRRLQIYFTWNMKLRKKPKPLNLPCNLLSKRKLSLVVWNTNCIICKKIGNQSKF